MISMYHSCVGNDKDQLFCLSLVKNLKEPDTKYKSHAKMQMLKVFHDIEWMKMSTIGPLHNNQYNPPMLQDPAPVDFSGAQNSWYSYP